MDTPTRVIFFAGLVGFTGLFFWLLQIETTIGRLGGPRNASRRVSAK
jgi:hypothetical protein